MRQNVPDFRLLNAGSLILLTPVSSAATRWARVNLPHHALRWGDGIVVEPAYFPTIADAILAADMTIHGREAR